jgi:uncharacterized protein with von Willebrand factor type A (vWA) domain
VFCIDKSGSMAGEREVWAMACALAIMEVARIQKRGFAVIMFDGVPQTPVVFDPNRLDEQALNRCLAASAGGGTDVGAALHHALQLVGDPAWKPGKHADIVLLTDGCDNSDYSTATDAMKRAGVSLHTIFLQCPAHQNAGLVAASSTVAEIGHDDMRGATERLDPLFSI